MNSFKYRDKREHQALVQLSRILTENASSHQLHQESARLVMRLVAADYCYLLHFDNHINQLAVVASCGTKEAPDTLPVDGILKQAFDANTIINLVSSGGTGNEIAQLRILSEQLGVPAVSSCVLVPLARPSDVFGMILVAGNQVHSAQSFSSADLDLLHALAAQIVVFLQKASQSQALRALLAVSARVIFTSSERKALKLITNILVEKLNYRVAYLRFLLPDKRLRIFATAGTSLDYAFNATYDLPQGDGIANYVLQKRGPVAIRDVRHLEPGIPEFFFSELIEREQLRGLVSVPVILDGEVIGTLSCYTGRPCNFNNEDIQLLETFANLAAAAYVSTQSFKALEELEKAGQILSSKVRIEDVLQAVVENIPSQVRGDGAFICPFESRTGRLAFEKAVSIGLGKNLIAWDHSKHQHAHLVKAILNTSTIVVSDITAPPNYLHFNQKTRHLLQRAGINSFIGLRLQTQEGELPVGVLFVNYHIFPTQSKLEETLHILRIYADQAAQGIGRARGYERLVHERELLKSLTYATSAVKDVKATCQEILDGAIRITGAERGNISRIFPGTDFLRDVVSTGPIWVGKPRDLRVGKAYQEGIQGWVAAHKQPVLIDNVKVDPRWKEQYVVGNPDTISELTVPILDGVTNALVGIINLESSQEAAFDEEDLELLQALAVHAAMSIQTAERHQRLNRYLKQLKALQSSIALTQSSIDRQTMLQTILRRAAELTNAHFATIQRVDGNKLLFEAVFPESHRNTMIGQIGEHLPMHGKGITVKVACEGKPFYAKDVRHYPELYVDPGLSTTRSELAIPLLNEDSIWGVLNVEALSVDAFSDEDIDALEALGAVALTALKSAKYAKELSRTNSLAVMGAWGAEVAHDVNRAVGNIRLAVDLIRVRENLPEDVVTRLSLIERNLVRLRMPPMPNELPQAAKEKIHKAPLDLTVSTVIEAGRSEADKGIQFVADLNCPGKWASIDADWLSRLLRHLIHNAIRAIDKQGTITIRTQVEREMATVLVEDTGKGIPDEIKRSLFVQPVLPSNAEGTGSGLLWVGYIAEQYGGKCQLVWTEVGKGSIFELKLPVTEHRHTISNLK